MRQGLKHDLSDRSQKVIGIWFWHIISLHVVSIAFSYPPNDLHLLLTSVNAQPFLNAQTASTCLHLT
jgi:hypothetical protein